MSDKVRQEDLQEFIDEIFNCVKINVEYYNEISGEWDILYLTCEEHSKEMLRRHLIQGHVDYIIRSVDGF